MGYVAAPRRLDAGRPFETAFTRHWSLRSHGTRRRSLLRPARLVWAFEGPNSPFTLSAATTCGGYKSGYKGCMSGYKGPKLGYK